MKFRLRVRETFSRIIIVEADSPEQAIQFADGLYADESGIETSVSICPETLENQHELSFPEKTEEKNFITRAWNLRKEATQKGRI